MKTITGTIPASFLRLVGEEAQNKRAFAMIEKPVRGVALKSFRPSDDYLRLIGHPAATPARKSLKDFLYDLLEGLPGEARDLLLRMRGGCGCHGGMGQSCGPCSDPLTLDEADALELLEEGEYEFYAPTPAERAEYAPEVKGDAEWVEWKGGAVPDLGEQLIEVRSRGNYNFGSDSIGGSQQRNVRSAKYWREFAPQTWAHSWHFAACHIVAYRLVK